MGERKREEHSAYLVNNGTCIGRGVERATPSILPQPKYLPQNVEVAVPSLPFVLHLSLVAQGHKRAHQAPALSSRGTQITDQDGQNSRDRFEPMAHIECKKHELKSERALDIQLTTKNGRCCATDYIRYRPQVVGIKNKAVPSCHPQHGRSYCQPKHVQQNTSLKNPNLAGCLPDSLECSDVLDVPIAVEPPGEDIVCRLCAYGPCRLLEERFWPLY